MIHGGSEAIRGKKVIRMIGISFKDTKSLDGLSFFSMQKIDFIDGNPKCVGSSAVDLVGAGRGFTVQLPGAIKRNFEAPHVYYTRGLSACPSV